MSQPRTRSRMGTALALGALVAQAFLLAAAGPWTLRLEANGSVRLEMQGSPCCRDVPKHLPHEGDESCPQPHDACGDCIDLTFRAPRHAIICSRSSFSPDLDAPAALTSPLAAPPLAGENPLPGPLPTASPALPCGHASTVILC